MWGLNDPRRKRAHYSAGSCSTTLPAEKKERDRDGDQDHAEGRLSRHFQSRIAAPVRRPKLARGYAAPSVYQHLAHLPDLIIPNLDGTYPPPPPPFFFPFLLVYAHATKLV
ncbi:hypothetical protein VP01_987g1 [Puccinia sorghi]|uniref:Uncharacterized protein n=1 Tax=Puccinia sorghi TaxID=27349 RepID=A0A0L6U7I6_9BASI|nr:hypothetical protein VP01_987g1 [Puccinia sorghi]